MRHPIGLSRHQWLRINEPLYVREKRTCPCCGEVIYGCRCAGDQCHKCGKCDDHCKCCPDCHWTGIVLDYYRGQTWERKCGLCGGEK